MSTSGFGNKIAEYQDEYLSRKDMVENDIEAVRQRLFAPANRFASRPKKKVPVIAFGFAAAVAALAMALLLWVYPVGQERVSTDSASTADATGKWLNARLADKSVVFTDNSKILLKKGATGRVLTEHGHCVHFLLEQGRARVNVKHYSDTNWLIDAGPYKVAVIGTQFLISWDPNDQVFELKMIEGIVKITGPNVAEGKLISKKETFIAGVASGEIPILPDENAEHTDTVGDDTSIRSDTQTHAGESAVQEPHIKQSASSRGSRDNKSRKVLSKTKTLDAAPSEISWQALNREGKYAEVVADARKMGLAKVFGTKPTSELLQLGDAARLQKDWALSKDAYLALRKREPAGRNAAIAAFSIGRIAFDAHRDFGAAARWLEIYLKEAPNGRLEREALGRLMEAQQKSGNITGARRSAARYLNKFPRGPHADVANSILKK
ncbi:MAG: FecR domain-containing protein [Deltaproteobacteria bacterium]|nr:FecR domain-containing protein [Deltaproteobacteria bacterium]